MALAELGEFGEAVDVQRDVIGRRPAGASTPMSAG